MITKDRKVTTKRNNANSKTIAHPEDNWSLVGVEPGLLFRCIGCGMTFLRSYDEILHFSRDVRLKKKQQL